MRVARRRRPKLEQPAFRREYTFLHRWDPARYPPAYLRTGIPEDQVQDAIVGYLRFKWRAVVTVIDAGDRRLRGRAAAMLSAAGADPHQLVGRGGTMQRGVVDLAVTFANGRAGWFEVKRPALLVTSPSTGRLVQEHAAGEATPEQLDFLAEQERHGAFVGVLWHAKDLDAIVPAGYGLTRELVRHEDHFDGPVPETAGKDLSEGPA